MKAVAIHNHGCEHVYSVRLHARLATATVAITYNVTWAEYRSGSYREGEEIWQACLGMRYPATRI